MELKPCPFCGECNASAYKAKPDSIFDTWGVWCDCGAKITGYDEKQEAIDAWNTRTESKEITSLKSELAALKERDRWIPISEWLPGIKQEVLCTHQKDKWVSTGYRKNKWQWYDTHDQCCEIIVTHWRPLPEAPKEVC